MVNKWKMLSRLIVAAALGGLIMATAGCGPESQTVTAPEPTNNTPPGGGSADDYAKKMAEIQGKGGQGGMPGSGGPPGPGNPR